VAHGGTGDVSLTAHCVLVGAGTSAAHLVCPTMSGYVLTDNGSGSDPSFQAATGGGGTPGGSSGQLQYNNAGAFGGVAAVTCSAHQWLNVFSNTPACSQPAFSDISGSVAASQLPNPTASTLGGIESLASVSHKWINAISTAGVPSATQPACADISDATAYCNASATNGITLANIAQIGANTALCNATGSTANVAACTVPDCHSAGNALIYTAGAGAATAIGCTTITASTSFANPSATAGPTAINGSASTAMRSDAAPAIQLTTSSQPGLAQVDGVTIGASSGVISVIGAAPSSSYSVPSIGSYTWVNQGAATATQTTSGGSVLMTMPLVAGLNWRGLFATPPATPYKVKAQFASLAGLTITDTGLYFYDGTKLMGLEFLGLTTPVHSAIRVEKITNVTTDNSNPFLSEDYGTTSLADMWFQIRNNGTTLFFDVSRDGVNFLNLYSEAVGTFITPTKIGYGGATQNSHPMSTWWMNFIVYNNANLN
jgi:hypothetical protein